MSLAQTVVHCTKCNLSIILRGYASSFEWAGHHDDETTRDRWGRRSTHIVAIDALVFRSMVSQLRPGESSNLVPRLPPPIPSPNLVPMLPPPSHLVPRLPPPLPPSLPLTSSPGSPLPPPHLVPRHPPPLHPFP